MFTNKPLLKPATEELNLGLNLHSPLSCDSVCFLHLLRYQVQLGGYFSIFTKMQ